jgi:hypothetical protein
VEVGTEAGGAGVRQRRSRASSSNRGWRRASGVEERGVRHVGGVSWRHPGTAVRDGCKRGMVR